MKWIFFILMITVFWGCSKSRGIKEDVSATPSDSAHVVNDSSLVNATHLKDLEVAVTFENGEKTLGVNIYSNAPLYNPVSAEGEGFACVDDVARAALFYLKSSKFNKDTVVREKVYGFIRFIINMQSDNGYFYNFVKKGDIINKYGSTSINQPKWWSWRALRTLTVGLPIVQSWNATLAGRMAIAIKAVISAIKADLIYQPMSYEMENGIKVPQWLPEGSDQASTLILGLVPYCLHTKDTAIEKYIKKLSEGIVASQLGNANQFPYGVFLSSGNLWHAYGNDQSHALFVAAQFLGDDSYANKALMEVDNFYPWVLNNDFVSSFRVKMANTLPSVFDQQQFEQIAYNIRPMVSAAVGAYNYTGDKKYTGLAGKIASWFLGNNPASMAMYSKSNGLCFDAIAKGNKVNKNSGAESTIEALLTMQMITKYPGIKTAMLKYKR